MADDYGDVIRGTFGEEQSAALSQTVGNIEASPDEASRALRLHDATGVPAPVILGDLPSFERNHRSQLASEIVRNNQYITSYVANHPLASHLSNDDYGQLDVVSQATQKLGEKSVLGAMIEGFRAGFDYEGLEAENQRWITFSEDPLWKSFVNSLTGHLVQTAGVATLATMKAFQGGMYGVAAGASQFLQNRGIIDEGWGNRFTRDIIAAFEANTAGPMMFRGPVAPRVKADMREAARLSALARPYLEAGIEPPTGLHPTIDKVKELQNKQDLDALNELVREAQASTTKERNPEIFASFIRQHTNAKIGVSADAIAELYGNKMPDPEDGLLGWVPEIRDQLETALATGGDVEIPMADWVANVDPGVARQLNDFTRVRPGGVTKFEAQLAKEAEDVEAPPVESPESPIDALRHAAGILPSRPEQLTLRKNLLDDKALREGLNIPPTDRGTFHDFSFHDAYGQEAGYVTLKESPDGKNLYIEYISADPKFITQGGQPNAFGPRMVRDLLRQLKEQFPNAETISGHRVSGAREQANKFETVSVKFAEDIEALVNELALAYEQIASTGPTEMNLPATAQPGGKTYHYRGTDVTAEPFYTTSLGDMLAELDFSKYGELARSMLEFARSRLEDAAADIPIVVLSDADIHKVLESNKMGRKYGATPGFYDPVSDVIVVSEKAARKGWEAANMGFADFIVHEGVHGLTHKALNYDKEIKGRVTSLMEYVRDKLTDEELKIVEYGMKNPDEFMAEAFSDARFQEIMSTVLLDEAVAKEIGLSKGATAWDAMKHYIRQLLERAFGIKVPPTAIDGILEIGKQIEAYNSKQGRDIYSSPEYAQFRDQLQYAKPIQEAPIKRDAMREAMTQEQYDRYMRLIDKRSREDLKHETEKALANENHRQTKEWKEREIEERKEAVKDVNARPDVAADALLREGVYFGTKLDESVKIGRDFLSPEQQAKLPQNYYRKDGLHPDDIAQLVGLPDGPTLLASLDAFVEARGSTRPGDYVRKLITAETTRRMEAKYGRLADNIMEELKDRLTDTTQVEMLHEETLALGLKAGSQGPITKEMFSSWVADKFAKLPADMVTFEKMIRDAGKAGRAAEDALLKGKFDIAFREKQRQYVSLLMAQQARILEKEQKQFDKTVKRFRSREVKGVGQEYTNQIHDLMQKAGLSVRRSQDDVRQTISGDQYKTLPEFVIAKNAEGWEIDVQDYLQAGQVKPFDEMTVQEFKDFKAAVDSIAHAGRESQKIEVAGQKQDYIEWRDRALDIIRSNPLRPHNKQNKWRYQWDAELTRVEEMVKDLEQREELGPLFNAIIRPMMDAKHKEYQLQEGLVKRLENIKGYGKEWQKSLNDSIPQDFLFDPYYPDGPVLFDLTRSQMLNIMLNFGNRSNIEKFTRGYGGKERAKELEARLWNLFDRHATKEDWDFVQNIWDVFEDWRGDAERMYRNLSGLPPVWIKPEGIATRHGQYKGGYFPIIYDKLRSPIEIIQESTPPGDLFKQGYYRATTGNRYTKERTGFYGAIDFEGGIDQVAARMYQQIHDIAYRPAVMQVGKIISDRSIRDAITKHYGKEYADQLRPWLEDIANHYNSDDKTARNASNFLRRMRMNLLTHSLGYNLKVILSPNMGSGNFKSYGRVLSNPKAAYDLAMEKSKEIPHSFKNMDRDFREKLEEIALKGGWTKFQQAATTHSFKGIVKVDQFFRVATFDTAYRDALARGLEDADAAALADSIVRERHGSTGIPDLPAIMRGSEAMKTFTVFYGFFNTMYNWQRQIPGAVRGKDYERAMTAAIGAVVIPAAFGALLFNKADEKDGWFYRIAKALTLQPLQTVPFVREAASLFLEGFNARSPWASVVNSIYAAGRDLWKFSQGKKVDKPIQHGANVIGLTTGLPLGQIGRSAQYQADVMMGKQKPKNILEWGKGIIFGSESK